MHSIVPMHIAKIGHVVLSVAIIVLACLLLVGLHFPFAVWETVCGVLLVLLGAVKITGYASKDLYRLAFQYDFVFGCVLAGVGLVFLFRPSMTVEIAGTILGLVVFSDGALVADYGICGSCLSGRTGGCHLPLGERCGPDHGHGRHLPD